MTLLLLIAQAGAFPYGVASGDPTQHSAIIWTRVEVSFARPADVHYEVATDRDFKNIVSKGVFRTGRWRDHTVKVKVDNLKPNTTYYYRFWYVNEYYGQVDTLRSPVGKFKTLPSDTNRFRVVLLACQHFSAGYYTVYKYILQDSVDLMIHTGDFIYEFPTYRVRNARPDPTGYAYNLETYRMKYKLGRTDRYFQEALRNIPIAVIWDDHEVVNDYSGKTMFYYNRDRIKGAYQAFFEYVPIEENPEEKFRIYRDFKIGDFLHIFMIDGRQYRDEDACRPAFNPSDECAHMAMTEYRTYLGEEQRKWLMEGVASSDARWKLIVNNTMMMDFFKNGKPIFVDQWDGFYWEKQYILRYWLRKGVKNIIVGTGDTHTFYFGDVMVDGKKVATEVVTSAVTSPGGHKALEDLKENPWIKYMNNDYRGYVLLDFFEDHVDVYMYGIEDVTVPDSKRILVKKFRIDYEK